MIKYNLASFLFLFFTFSSLAQNEEYKTGDLIFQVNKISDFSQAIAETTSGKDYNYTHVGIIYIENDSAFVLEATRPEVTKTPILEFINNSETIDNHYIAMVARVKSPYRQYIPTAISFAKSALKKPYDDFFIPNNNEYYCSELVYEAFRKENGEYIFEAEPMTFKDNDGNFHKFWIQHYQESNISIPEGVLGSNPGDLSKSRKLRIIQVLIKQNAVNY